MNNLSATSGTVKDKALTVPVLLLILLSFALGTSEFIVIGILPEISEGLNTSLALTGSMVSAFAAAYAVGTPIITAVTSRINKYKLMLGFLTVFTLGNVLSIFASNIVTMYASRIMTASVSGAILAVSMLFANEITPEKYTARVVSWIFSGFSIASVVGIPIGTLLTQSLSYHAAFAFVAVISAALAGLLAYFLPKTSSKANTERLTKQLIILKDPKIYLGIFISLFGLGGTYVVYTFFTPILEDVLSFNEKSVSVILLIFGICSIISNLTSGKVGEKYGIKGLTPLYITQILLFLAMILCLRSKYAGLIALLIMGILMYIYNTSTQLHFINTTEKEYPYAENLASSLLPMAANFGIAFGSLLGSTVQEYMGFYVLPIFAAVLEAAALLCLLSLKKRIN